MSATDDDDPTMYGRLGSQKWENELERFLADRGISIEDVQRWTDKKSQVKDPLPEIQKSGPPTKNWLARLWNFGGGALQSCSHDEAVHGVPSVLSPSSSTDNQYLGNPVVIAGTFYSAKNVNYYPSLNTISSEDTSARGCESGISNVSVVLESSHSDLQHEAHGRLSLSSSSPDIFLPTPEKSSGPVRRKLKRLTPSTSKSMRPRNTPRNQGLLRTPRRNVVKGKRYTQRDKEYLVRLLLNVKSAGNKSGGVMEAHKKAARFLNRSTNSVQLFCSRKLLHLNIEELMALKLTKYEAQLYKKKYKRNKIRTRLSKL